MTCCSNGPSPTPPALQELFSFDWAAMRRQAEEAQRRAAASATVHAHGCPWVLPRPLFVLTLSNDASHRFYTLRTRVQKEQEVTDELARVSASLSFCCLHASWRLRMQHACSHLSPLPCTWPPSPARLCCCPC